MWVGQQYDDCWSFARAYYAQQGIDLPATALLTQSFHLVEVPRTGDLVIIDGGAHCGVYVDGCVLNHIDKFGVVSNRANQFFQPRHYRYCDRRINS